MSHLEKKIDRNFDRRHRGASYTEMISEIFAIYTYSKFKQSYYSVNTRELYEDRNDLKPYFFNMCICSSNGSDHFSLAIIILFINSINYLDYNL